MTDTADFVVFNLCVPSDGAMPLSCKMKRVEREKKVGTGW